MKIIPGIIENDFDNFTKGISVIQKNMSKIFYGKSNQYASKKITKDIQLSKCKWVLWFWSIILGTNWICFLRER